jgi:hypothetical protein
VKVLDPFWCQLRDEAQHHPAVCPVPLCGRYTHVDGNCKVIRSCCHKSDVELFETAIGRVVRGCPNTPLRGGKYCAQHTVQGVQGEQSGAAVEPEEGGEGSGAEDATDDKEGEEDGDEEALESMGNAENAGSEGGQGSRVTRGGREPANEAEQTASGTWDLDSAPLSVRTRLKRKILEKEQLYEVERIVGSKKKNGVSSPILDAAKSFHCFWILHEAARPAYPHTFRLPLLFY